MNKAGELTVICGGMFSGKSTELQRQGRRKELAGEVVAYFKPEKDNRYTAKAISTHDGSDVDAFIVSDSFHIVKIIYEFEKSTEYKIGTVCIDEIQFFEQNIITVIDALLEAGIDVVVAGLDMDRFGKPFKVTALLMAIAEKVIKLNAVCSECGSDAWVSHGEFEDVERVVIGEKDKYIPLCRTCFHQRIGKEEKRVSNIKRLREIGELETYIGDYASNESRELVEDIDIILETKAEVVHSEFEEGGRWSNYQTYVYKLEEDGETAYFEVTREVPATEIQEGMELWFHFQEVVPYEVTITKYRGV